MKNALQRDKYFLSAMTALALLLAGVLWWEWARGMSLQQDLLKMRKMPVTPVPTQKILPEFSLPGLETGFPEFSTRPIFAISRRPFVSDVQADAGAMKKGQFVLVGVLISPGQRAALLRDVATGKVQTVAQSGVVRGLTLAQVQPDRVLLRQSEESEELPLNVQTGPKLVPPQRTMVAPAQPAQPPAAVSKPQAPVSAAGAAVAPALQAASSAPSSSIPKLLPVPPPQAAPGLADKPTPSIPAAPIPAKSPQ